VVDERGQHVAETLGATLQFLDGTRSQIEDIDSWHYDVEWNPLGIAASIESTAPLGCVIAVSEDQTVGSAFVEHLRGLSVAAEYVQASDDGSPRLITRNEADEIVRRLSRTSSSTPGHVIYVTTTAERSFDDVEGVEQTVLARCGSLLHLAQALTHKSGTPAGRLWVVSRQAVRVGNEVPTLTQAPLWALGRSLSIECGTAWGGLIDFDPAAHAVTLAREVTAVVGSSDFEDQLAFRDGWHVPRLVRRQLPIATESAGIDPSGSYLVTGGFGGLGLVVADWLARRGARHLVLVGRQALPSRAHWDQIESSDPRARAIAVVRELEAGGVSVRVEAADVGSSSDVARVLQAALSNGVPLRGVVHAAGVPQYEPLHDQTIESFRRAFGGKLRGAWLLDRMCGTDVEEFVLFSSASAILNSPFAGAYAAANAFLDALALNRTSRGRRGLSMGWGMWGDVGMVARFEAGDRRAGELGRAISPNQGIASLERALASNAAHVVVLPINWHEWRRQYGRLGCAPFLSRLVDPEGIGADDGSSKPPARAGASLDAGQASTEQRLCAEFERVMDVAPDALEMDVPLISMGLDSLMAVELRAAIENSVGVTLPLLRFLEGATVRDIVREVASQTQGPDRALPISAAVLVEEGEI
jgi:acyl carrier protein/NADP-dependent 3-hydroxy acid dehydrogenase YdfG